MNDDKYKKAIAEYVKQLEKEANDRGFSPFALVMEREEKKIHRVECEDENNKEEGNEYE